MPFRKPRGTPSTQDTAVLEDRSLQGLSPPSLGTSEPQKLDPWEVLPVQATGTDWVCGYCLSGDHEF